MSEYAKRDIGALDRAGNYYSRHVHAMIGESLHDKSDIAAELAVRDVRIWELERYNLGLANESCAQQELIAQLEADAKELRHQAKGSES